MTATCPACRKPMDYHTDRGCIEAQRCQTEVARVILRNTMAVPFREEISRTGQRVSVVIALSDAQYQTLKRFAEE